MNNKFQNLTVDFSQLRSIPIQERVALAGSPLGNSIFGNMSPTEIARLFPKYYQDTIPAIGGLAGAVSGGTNMGGGSSGVAPAEPVPLTLAQRIAQAASAKKYGTSSPGQAVSSAEHKRNIILAMNKAGISDPQKRAAIAAVIAGETGWTSKSEGSYAGTSSSRIRGVFKGKFNGMSDSQIDQLKKDPTAFFNFVYDNKNGNGTGEGYKYRGRGLFQLTGKGNYERYGGMVGVDLVNNPDLANNPEVAAALAVAYINDRYDSAPGIDVREKVFRAVGTAVLGTEEVKNQSYQEYLQSGAFEPGAIAQYEEAIPTPNPHVEEGTDAAPTPLATDGENGTTTGPEPTSRITPETIGSVEGLDPKVIEYAGTLSGADAAQFYENLNTLGNVDEINKISQQSPSAVGQTPSQMTVQEATVQYKDAEYQLTDKLGAMSPQLRPWTENEDPGASLPGEFNYSLTPEGAQQYGIADQNGNITPESVKEQLTTIQTNGGARFTLNKNISEKARLFLNDLEARGYPVSSSGGFAWRQKNGGASGLSTHATGTTFDINSGNNGGTMKGQNPVIDLPPDVEKLANFYGFSWGAKFGDPMHFESMPQEVHTQKLAQLEEQGYIAPKPYEQVNPTPNEHVQTNDLGAVETDAAPVPVANDSNTEAATAPPEPVPVPETTPEQPTAVPEQAAEVPAQQMAQGGYIDQKDNLQVVDKTSGDVKAEINNGELQDGIDAKGGGLQVKSNVTRKADDLIQKYDDQTNVDSPTDPAAKKARPEERDPVQGGMSSPIQNSQAASHIGNIPGTNAFNEIHASLHRAYGLSRDRMNYGNVS